MALQAPLHLERLLLPDERHLVHAPVARRAADSLVHVGAVVEIGEIGEVVHLHPFDRSVGAEARPHRLEGGALRPDLRMAVHAGLGRGDSGVGRPVHRGVAVAALHPEPAHVVRVAEGHRLAAGLVRARDVGGPVHCQGQPDDARDDEDRAEDADLRQGVGAVVEDLCHSAQAQRRVVRGTKVAASLRQLLRARQQSTSRRTIAWGSRVSSRARSFPTATRASIRFPPRLKASTRIRPAVRRARAST